MSKIVQKRWLKLFVTVAVLVTAQVVWWTDVFFRDVDTIARLTRENAALKSSMGAASGPPAGMTAEQTAQAIEKTVFHRRFMFLSESLTFIIFTAFGLYLLFRALRSEEQGRETQRNFIDTLTHESKTPLTALKLRLEAMLEKNQANSPLRGELQKTLEEVRRLSSIFEKALNLNRMERYDFSFEEICLSDVVTQVAKRMEPLLRERSVVLELKLQDDAYVAGDAYGLENTVQSLLENAVFYNDKDRKEVSIIVERQSDGVRLEISDNGPGISETDRLHLFERFYRGKSSRRTPGTGLGLYIARYIVEAHSGAIRLIREYTNGSCFEVLIPSLPRQGGESL